MRLLVVLAYYNRPQMVRNALWSVGAMEWDDWALAVVDDGSEVPIRPIAEEMLHEDRHRMLFYHTGDSLEQKVGQGGSRHGQLINEAIAEVESDVVIVLCDDDALIPGAVPGLMAWFESRPEAVWCYGKVWPFDPTHETPGPHLEGKETPLNRHTEPINPSCQVDSSQIAFRRRFFDKVQYPSPMTMALDAEVFHMGFDAWGPCPPCGIPVQYKGVFPDQMGNRPGRWWEVRNP